LPPNVAETPFSNYFNFSQTSPQAAKNVLPFPGNGLGKIYECPVAPVVAKDNFLDGGSYGFFCYCMDIDLKLQSSILNGVTGNEYGYPTMPNISSIRFPSAQVLMMEETFSPTMENYSYSPTENGTQYCERWLQFTKRHCGQGGGGVLAFLDGHAGWFTWAYVYNPNANPYRLEKFNPDIWWDPNRDIATPP
jgi:hypothetical protein